MKKPIPFGKYWLLDRVNVGGMAEVWKAKAFGVEGFERLVAVKRILPNIAEDEEFITMFIDEAKIAVQLNHANICQIFDLGKVEESYFIALEFVHGKDLRAIFDRVKQRPVDGVQSMPIAQACFIIMKACEGLDYAHNKRDVNGRALHLVHRDVSPQNILISYEGEVKLIDFGIAKAAGKASKTQQGILKGKFGYMSPEQVRGLPLDRRSDVFSLGIVLYELLTGERLFIGESDFATLEKVRNVEILPPSTYNRRISDELERIVLKALAKDVDERYQNAIDLHDDLQAFMYAAGEFYSRKDLAGWMKRVFAQQIEEEAAKLEQFRDMPPLPDDSVAPPFGGGDTASERLRRNSGAFALPPAKRPSGQVPILEPPPMPVATPQASELSPPPAPSDFGWDDEELATDIYGGPPAERTDPMQFSHQDFGHLELSPDGAPVPHHSVATQLPSANHSAPSMVPLPVNDQNGHGRRSPFDFVPPSAERMPALTPIMGVPVRRRLSSVKAYVPVSIVAAALVVALAGGVVYYKSRPGTLYVASEPASEVQILIDNKPQPIERTPARLELEPHVYVLTIKHDGYLPYNEKVEVSAGGETRRRITLEPLASDTGFTLVSEPAGARAVLDGRPLEGVTPLKVQSIAPGKHRLDVRSAAGSWSGEVMVEAGKILDVRAPLVMAVPPKRAVVRASGGAAARLLAERSKESKESSVSEPRPRRPAPSEAAPAAAAPAAPVASAPSARKEASKDPLDSLLDGLDGNKKPEGGRAEAKAAASRPAGEGYLRVGSKPWANIAVDGKETGMHTPQRQIKLPAGSHRITLSNPQFNIKDTFVVEIKAGETETVIKDLKPGE